MARSRTRRRSRRRRSTAARGFPGLVGLDLAKDVSSRQTYNWRETPWVWNKGYGERRDADLARDRHRLRREANILRMLAGLGADITVVPAQSTLEDVMRAQAGRRAAVQRPRRSGGDGRHMPSRRSRGWSTANVPVFGICLGHQMLGLALGAQTARWRRAITARTIR